MSEPDAILNYPVEILADGAAGHVARLVDLPQDAVGRGPSPEAAYMALMESAMTAVTSLMIKGKEPQPSADEGRPTIGITRPAGMTKVQQLSLLAGGWKSGKMINYAWSANFVVGEP